MVYRGLVPMSPKTTPMAARARVNTSGFPSFAEADLIKVLLGRVGAENRNTRACDGSPAAPACDSWFRFFFVRRGPRGWGPSVIIAKRFSRLAAKGPSLVVAQHSIPGAGRDQTVNQYQGRPPGDRNLFPGRAGGWHD